MLPELVLRLKVCLCVAASCTVTALLIAGCGGGAWPRMAAVPADRIQQVSLEEGERHLVLPDSQPFNVHDRQSSQDPGQTGTARGESDATAAGTAYCRAEAADGGSASADFLLGHVLHSAAAEPVNVLAKFSFESDQKLTVSPDADTRTTGDYRLEAYVRDSNERIIRTVPLAASASDTGPRTASGSLVIEVPLEMKPKTAYHFLLAGKVEAKTAEGGSASALVEVKNLRLELTVEPQRSGGTGSGD